MSLQAAPAAGAQTRGQARPTIIIQPLHIAQACELAASVLEEVPHGIHSGKSGPRVIRLLEAAMPEAEQWHPVESAAKSVPTDGGRSGASPGCTAFKPRSLGVLPGDSMANSISFNELTSESGLWSLQAKTSIDTEFHKRKDYRQEET